MLGAHAESHSRPSTHTLVICLLQLQTGVNIVKNEGVLALYSGLGPAIGRGLFYGGVCTKLITCAYYCLCIVSIPASSILSQLDSIRLAMHSVLTCYCMSCLMLKSPNMLQNKVKADNLPCTTFTIAMEGFVSLDAHLQGCD